MVLHRSKTFLFLAVLLVAATITLIVVDIPLTRHAEEAHAGQLWTPATIQKQIFSGYCQPIYAWVCPNNILKVACPSEPGSDLWLGLIITGHGSVRELWERFMSGDIAACNEMLCISGWAARSSFWISSAMRDGCTAIVLP